MVEATYRVKEARKQLYSENGRYPENEEVAEATGLSMKKLTAVLMTPKAPRSLDQKIGINQNMKPSVRFLLLGVLRGLIFLLLGFLLLNLGSLTLSFLFFLGLFFF